MKSVLIVILSLCSFAAVHAQTQQQARPNIILILADDLGWSSLSCRMDKDDPRSASDYHETPNIDRLAREGMRFSRGYASAAICSPSRRSILFGQTPARLGDETFPEHYDPLTTSYRTIPQMLKAIDPGYRTAHYGKWDMRAHFFPEDAGYDESDGNTGNGNGNVFTDKDEKWTRTFLRGDPKFMFTLTGRATNFMQRQVRTGHPFYLQLSHYATHVDVQAQPDSYTKFGKKAKGKKHHHPGFAAMLADLDTSIGRILDEVERLGIANNTYIFFMADNGATEFFPPVRNRLDRPSTFPAPMRNFPLRGGKWTLYEGGIRVPFIVRGPGIAANSQCDIPVVGWDLLPTFSALAGESKLPKGMSDGASLDVLLRNGGHGKIKRPTDGLVFHRYHNGYPHSAIIDGDFKLISFWKTGKTELYNLASDPGEEVNIASEHVSQADALAARLRRYLDKVNAGLIETY